MSVPVRCGQELQMSGSVGWKQAQGCVSQGENSQGSWAVVVEASQAKIMGWDSSSAAPWHPDAGSGANQKFLLEFVR